MVLITNSGDMCAELHRKQSSKGRQLSQCSSKRRGRETRIPSYGQVWRCHIITAGVKVTRDGGKGLTGTVAVKFPHLTLLQHPEISHV